MSRPSKLDPFRAQIDALFKTYPDITAQRVFEILRDAGFGGGYTGVKDLVRRLRPKVLPTPSLQTPPRVPDLDQLRRAFANLGDEARQFLAALEQTEHRVAGHHARRILALRERYDSKDLLLALAHAHRYGALEHGAVERILLAKAPPRKLDEYVAAASARRLGPLVSESATEPRDLAEYDALPARGHLAVPQGEP